MRSWGWEADLVGTTADAGVGGVGAGRGMYDAWGEFDLASQESAGVGELESVAEEGFVFGGPDFEVVLEAPQGLVEGAAEGAVEVDVDPADGHFSDAETGVDDAGPELHGECVAGFGEIQRGEGGDAVGFETAEAVCETLRGEAAGVNRVDESGEAGVDGGAVLGGVVVVFTRGFVSGSGDEVPAVCGDEVQEGGDHFGLVLLVTVHGENPVETVRGSVVEGVDEGLAVAAILGVAEEADVGAGGELFGRSVGRAVVDEQHVLVIGENSAEHVVDVFELVVNGDGDEGSGRGGEERFARDCGRGWGMISQVPTPPEKRPRPSQSPTRPIRTIKAGGL